MLCVQTQQYRPAALPVPMKHGFTSGQCNRFKFENLSDGTKGIDCGSKAGGIFEKQPVPFSYAPQNKMLSSCLSNIRLAYEVRLQLCSAGRMWIQGESSYLKDPH